MKIIDLKNNLKNADFFRRHVHGARFNRGKNIPNKNLINFNVEDHPLIKVIAEIQGSGNSRYVINIFQEGSGFKIIHDCPDFKKGTKFCKHIVKILLLLESQVCQAICQSISSMYFTSDFSLIKKSKTASYILKAEDLIKHKKYSEAINFLHQAFDESRDFEYILKIGEIALKYNLYDYFLKYSVEFKELTNMYLTEYPNIISTLISDFENLNFSKKVEILINCQSLLINFPKLLMLDVFKQINMNKIEEPVLRYLLLHKFESDISIDSYFKSLVKGKKLYLKDLIEKKTLDLVNEAILNMDSEDDVNSFLIIAQNCKFTNSHNVFTRVQEHNKKIRDIFIDGLKLKHAFLRSLVIANTQTDKLRQMKFIKKYNYPSLIWTSPYKSEIPLHYYILEKCGYESHHLEYTDINNYVENYPVFKEIFNGNNPVSYAIKNFWKDSEPKITN
ncbi:MAG: hypothetical protein ACXAC7_23120, partial [Candidatus Hodarchaeales archaeon]